MKSNTFDGFSKSPVQAIVVIAFITALLLVGPQGAMEAQVLITFSNSQRVFQGEVGEGMVVFDAVTAAIQAGDVPLELSIDQARDITMIKHSGKMEDAVISVNATVVDAKKIHHTPIQPGDIISIKVL